MHHYHLHILQEKDLQQADTKQKRYTNSNLQRLSNNPKDREEVLKFEETLQQLGYVNYVSNLPDEINDLQTGF